MFQAFLNIFRVAELRRKVLFTLAMIIIYRVAFFVHIPTVDMTRIGPSGGMTIYDLINLVSGGGLLSGSILTLGIMPYISATIIFQLLMGVFPSLAAMYKEGEGSRRKIRLYERLATVGLCFVQGYMALGMLRGGAQALQPGLQSTLIAMLSITCGTMFLVWLGNMITEKGIGNGISLIIMFGIVARMPSAVGYVAQNFSWNINEPGQANPIMVVFLLAAFVLVILGVVLITQGQRRIPMQHARQIRGMRMTQGQRTYLPLRVNQSGVMPIIFASALLTLPSLILDGIATNTSWAWARLLSDMFNQNGGLLWITSYVLLIFFFAYFWTALQFKPLEIADELKKYGSFIPGIRPGKNTADFLEQVFVKITFVGATFLTVIALTPRLVQGAFNASWVVSSFYGGTGILIVVGVALDAMEQIESHLLMRHYSGFLGGKGRIKGRR